jgi:hemerythrin-like domain-containing protein
MRIWLVLFMVSLALFSPLIRSALRDSKRHIPALPRLQEIFYRTVFHNHSSIAQLHISTTPNIPIAMAATESATTSAASSEPTLPKLSSDDFRTYNRLAVMMDAYHRHFRHTWTILYDAASNGKEPEGISIRQFLSYGLQLCRQLTAHHQIEEAYVFPELAERMPIFAEGDHLIHQHEEIHVGLVKLEDYLRACLNGDRELRFPELREIMDGFGTVLWSHLDEEVKTLGAENMRKYWSKQEIMGMNW